jgi:ribA/ribD-fused uncharacterized protein
MDIKEVFDLIEQEMKKQITSFSGDYEFLSNFYESKITYEGITYPTLEHAFQAAKTLDKNERLEVSKQMTPGEAKHMGRKLHLRPDWEDIKIDVMEELLAMKFVYASTLCDLLVKTGDAELIEGNTWNDKFWGECKGEGLNWLGKLLMKRRKHLQELRSRGV